MSVLPAAVDYTDKDFDSIRARLVALVRSVFPDWTDFDVAQFGTLLLELYAFVGDVLGYYQDALARESRLVTATQRRNVIALARMLGYRLHGATAATAVVEVTLSAPPAAPVKLPPGSIVRTQEVTEPVRFQLLEELVIEAGANPPRATATAEHSASHVQLFDTRGLPYLDVVLDHTPYLDGSAIATAGNGAYAEVETLLNSGSNDRHFLVLVDQNDRATLRFGNGGAGAAPTGTLRVEYKTGGGAAGNVEANRLRVLEGTVTDDHGRAVTAAVTNPNPATGGTDRQTVASAKLLAPESLRTLTRSVTREDFEVNARRVAGVARALMLTSDEDPTIDENAGILFVIPAGGGLPTPALKNLVRTQVTEVYPCTLTFEVSVQDPVYRTVNVETRIFLRQGQNGAAVRERIRTNLLAMFAVSNADGTPNADVDFGFNVRDAEGNPSGEVAWSDVFNVVRDTLGVRKLDDGQAGLRLNGATSDVALALREFPVLGTVTVIDAATGSIL